MALEPVQQLKKILSECEEALIVLPQNPNGDLVGAGRALYYFLEKKEIKPVLAYVDQAGAREKLSFLPIPANEKETIIGARDFILSFNTRYNKIAGYRAEREGDEFRIYITPEKGAIDPRDFSFIPAKFKYDVLITLGCADKESAGKIYEENPDIFFEIPTVNIDNQATNENFGQINIVNLTASSVCEIAAGIIDEINSFSVDEKIAQCLLAGIVIATESFQNKKTTPKSLQVAARLIDCGADQQTIVRYLYKTQPLGVLKLWGRIMAKLKLDETSQLVWANVNLEDFVQSRTRPKDLFMVLNKIRENYSSGRFFLLLYAEETGTTKAVLACTNTGNIKKIKEVFEGEVYEDVLVFKIVGKSPNDAEKEIIEKIKQLENY